MTAALRKGVMSFAPALVGMLLVLAVIAANGRPSVFTDSDNYYSQGRNVVEGVGDLLFPDPVAKVEAPADPKVVAHERLRMKYKHTSMAARSP